MKAKSRYHLTPTQARTMLVASQGLIQPPQQASKEHVLAAIRQMGALQIDTINVVNRSPYLVLWSRIGAYPPHWLTDLLAERALFEYWAHAACFLPIEDYPLHRRLMLEDRRGWGSSREWIAEHPEIVEQVMGHVRQNGGARSADFERTDGQKGSWWNWKEEKIALERLFNAGELMIARRVNFQRVYDLRERILPKWDDRHAPPLDAVRRELALRTVKVLGIASVNWIADYFRMEKRGVPALVETLADEGHLLRTTVESWPGTFYVHADQRALLEDVLAGTIVPTRTVLLSPFDPVVWDRARLLAMFGFDYRIEVYTPEPKRKYGYFTLPILFGDRMVGRLDPKAHRKQKMMEIRAIHLEPEIPMTDELIHGLTTTVQEFSAWHGMHEVVFQAAKSKALAKALKRAQVNALAVK
ncbi:MAG TPA: crosslink repair DNA glycosylase YcaQ family protein [Aggregatilineales bacterium]|nr:crosslink repair DNA glycosylase YcaQ family protein [Aggregatilineales bacterium]